MTESGDATNNDTTGKSERGTYNTAQSGSTVGIQAEEVHNSTVYQLLPDASPREKYEVGVRYLEHGVPSRARELIDDAIAHEYDGGEVRFHWMLAMLSKRSYRDLTPEERQNLRRNSEHLDNYADDEWKWALRAICKLLDCLTEPGEDTVLALKELRAVQPRQRDKIIRHLDLVLTAGVRDSLWAETREAAERARLSGDRRERVWAYFHRDPIGPRVRKPAGKSTTAGDSFQAMSWSGLFVLAVGYIGWLVLAHAALLPVLAYLLALVASCVAARHGLEWRYRRKRLDSKDREYLGRWRGNRTPEGGFANRVDRSFQHYFSTYVPAAADRETWLAQTNGIRNALRDEVVELYRESRVDVERVNWLIQHLVSDVRRRWKTGTLLEYREHYRVAQTTKISCSLALLVLLPAASYVIVTAVRTNPLPAAAVTLLALVSARASSVRWSHIIGERWRLVEDHREYERQSEQRHAVYRRWKEKLDSSRPSENEMEKWLNCDKTMILDAALRHYQLAWRDIIAHAFLQTPAAHYRRARVSGGPWRYSKYAIRVFLITQDGVREVSTELDFERATTADEERNNFRFDAVSSVGVTTTGTYGYALQLTLMNGPTRNIRVTEPVVSGSGPDENPDVFSRMNLDATGFAHTLHILEGIAADGKRWIDRDGSVRGDPEVAANQSPDLDPIPR
ncbi:hypothetical protein H0B56_08225 [Haloechinothrix sp. YIM 98757]|uniref:Uncharacterized protein n=1 Tax=Haloechinothrix aidingensis TaxID=2752311 RepID=A0A838A899_9PSEU|nr:hypothetical protein [Haloechinothrix aidingensis]MBA0125525.1 hypothetical protein [Haloechinothrix aidingensis]